MKEDWNFNFNMIVCVGVLLFIIAVNLFLPSDNHAQVLSDNLEKAKNQVTQARYIDEHVCKDFESEFEDCEIFYENHSDIIDVTDQYSGAFKGWNIANGYVYETVISTHDDMEFSATYVFDKTADEPIATFYKGVNKAAIDFRNEMQFNS